MLFHTALPHFKTRLPLLCTPSRTAGSLWLAPTHISKCLRAALSPSFPWQVVWSGTSSMLLHDTGNRNCHSSAAAGTGFTLAKLEVELTSEARPTLNPRKGPNTESKVTQKMMTQSETENIPVLCWKPWTVLLQALSSGAMKSFLQSPSCFCSFPPNALKASKLSPAGRRYMLHIAIVGRKVIGAAFLQMWWRLITNMVWHFITSVYRE